MLASFFKLKKLFQNQNDVLVFVKKCLAVKKVLLNKTLIEKKRNSTEKQDTN